MILGIRTTLASDLEGLRSCLKLCAPGQVPEHLDCREHSEYDLFGRRRRDAEVLAAVAASSRGLGFQLGALTEAHTAVLAANFDGRLKCLDLSEETSARPNAAPSAEPCAASACRISRDAYQPDECCSQYGNQASFVVIDAAPDRDMTCSLSCIGYQLLKAGGILIWSDCSPLDGWRSPELRETLEGIRMFLERLEPAPPIHYLNESWCGVLQKPAGTISEAGRLSPAPRPMRVLILYDAKGWAWYHKAYQIQRACGGDIQVDVKLDLEPFAVDDYDYVMIFEANVLSERLEPRGCSIPPQKLIVGSSTPPTLPLMLRLLSEGRARAGFVNNAAVYSKIKDKKRVFCCQNGVDESLFFPAPAPPARFTACWVGKPRPVKGLEFAVEGCKRAGVPLKFVDNYVGQSRQLLSQQLLRDDVYHVSSVYICVSETEGTPNPALEALACGLPVVSTNVGNMPELIVDGVNGYLIERSADAVAEALRKLQQSDLAPLRFNARRSILDGWTWTQKAANYRAMLRRLRAEDSTTAAGR